MAYEKKGSNFRNYAIGATVQTDVPLHPPNRSLFLYLIGYDLGPISQKVENHGNASFSQQVDNVATRCEIGQKIGKSVGDREDGHDTSPYGVLSRPDPSQ